MNEFKSAFFGFWETVNLAFNLKIEMSGLQNKTHRLSFKAFLKIKKNLISGILKF